MRFSPQLRSVRPLQVALLLTFALSIPSARAQASPKPPAAPKAAAPKPPADVVTFTNGDQLTGKFEKGAGNSIVFKSDMAGEITIPLDKVKQLTVAGSFAVLRKDHPIQSIAAARAIAPGTIAYSAGKLTVTRPAAPPEVIPEAQIAHVINQADFAKETHHGSFRDGWTGAINGGATIVRSTDYGETFTAGIALQRSAPQVSFLPARDRTTFNLQETYGKLTSPVIPQTTPPSAPAVTLTSIFHADGERDQYFSPRFFALGQTAFDHNYSQGLSLQQVYGGGIGWTALKSSHQEMDIKASVQYENQTYLSSSNTPDQDIIGSTFSESYHRTLPRKLLFAESFNALPAWNNTRDYSANGSIGLVMPVFKRLSLSVTTTDNFLNDPAAGYNKNSYQFITAASYTLK